MVEPGKTVQKKRMLVSHCIIVTWPRDGCFGLAARNYVSLRNWSRSNVALSDQWPLREIISMYLGKTAAGSYILPKSDDASAQISQRLIYQTPEGLAFRQTISLMKVWLTKGRLDDLRIHRSNSEVTSRTSAKKEKSGYRQKRADWRYHKHILGAESACQAGLKLEESEGHKLHEKHRMARWRRLTSAMQEVGKTLRKHKSGVERRDQILTGKKRFGYWN